jgi:hypothetical protein
MQAELERVAAHLHELRVGSHAESLARHRAHLEAVERALHEVRHRVQTGAATSAELAKAEAELARAHVALNDIAVQHADQHVMQSVERARVQSDMERLQRELERGRSLFEQGLISREVLADLEVRLNDAEKRQLATQVAQIRDASVAREQAARRSAEATQATDARHLYELLAGRVTSLESTTDRGMVATIETPTHVVAAGDLLRIRITGEPDLPSIYQIRQDGSIRVPLMQAVRATGQTLAQIRQALERQLAGRPGSPKVDVAALRPRDRRDPR